MGFLDFLLSAKFFSAIFVFAFPYLVSLFWLDVLPSHLVLTPSYGEVVHFTGVFEAALTHTPLPVC